MAGFDIGRFLETGGKYAYEILSEEKKHKKTMVEIEAKIKGEREEEERKRQAAALQGAFTSSVNLLGSANINADTKRYIEQSYVIPLAQQIGIPYTPFTQVGMGMAPAPAEVPTAGTTMPGGTAGVEGLYTGGYTKPVTGEIPRMFEPSAVEPKPSTVSGDKRLFAPTPPAPKTPTPIAPEKIREQAYRLTTSVMRGPQFQELLSGLDPKARIKFEKDFAQMLERTLKFLLSGQFPEMTRTEEEWDELLGE